VAELKRVLFRWNHCVAAGVGENVPFCGGLAVEGVAEVGGDAQTVGRCIALSHSQLAELLSLRGDAWLVGGCG
jgi:hypothetical protein